MWKFEFLIRGFIPLVPKSNVLWHGSTAVRTYIGLLDLLVIASLSEGMPMVALEALSAGVPMVATRAGGLNSLIERGCGAPIEVYTVDAILNPLLGLEANVLARVSSRAKVVFNQQFTAVRMAEGYSSIDECAIAGKVST